MLKEKIKGKLYLLKKKSPKLYSFCRYLYHKIKGIKKNREKLLMERYIRTFPEPEQEKKFKFECHKKTKIYASISKAKAIKKLFKNVEISTKENEFFFYSLDVYKSLYHHHTLMVNSTLDYKKVVYAPIKNLYINKSKKNEFVSENNLTVNAIEIYLKRCIKYVKNSNMTNKHNILIWLENMYEGKATTFEEGLQRILFINMIQWQTEHRLVGLGRLDCLLESLYQKDIQTGVLTPKQAIDLIKDFFSCLHKYYWFKSDALMGDTGQIIILGGNQENGKYFCNDLTYIFIEAIKELQLPDPKILLRTGKNMPRDLMEKAIDCIKTGIGSPLLSNDDVVIPKMIEFGYEKEDAYNYVTSACWEPLIPGIAHEQNNIGLINFLLPFQLISEKEGFSKFNTMEELLQSYSNHLKGHIYYVQELLNQIFWEKDPFISAYTDSCREKYVDISDGGGKYNNYGILSLAMSNAVHAFINIKKYVFENKYYTMQELDFYRKNNFNGQEEIRMLLKQEENSFGKDSIEAIKLTNYIFGIANEAVTTYRNRYGGKAKFGLSSPGYITASKTFPASFDGRKDGEPFSVHISSDGNNSYTELMQFAAQLNYSETRFNGNVVDFFVAPNFIDNNFNKFIDFVLLSLNAGVFQIQINVVSSDILIAAKKEPKKYPNLIVRVWGFNAYYSDLPEEYKNYLIERALQSEHAN